TYGLAESGGPSGYTASLFTCVLTGTATPVTVTNASVVVGLGQNVTCTINNDDNEPQLHLVKTVTNDNGGVAVPSNWTLTATGPTGFSGLGPQVNNGASFDAGTYGLAESGGPSGYTASLFTCVLTGTATPVTVTNASVVVGLGQNVTCTINNDDNEPQLHLVKTVTNDNGGVAVPSNWTLTATGPTGFSGLGPQVNNGASFDAGTYGLAESGGPSGYTASLFTCVLTGTATPVTVTNASVVVGLGQNITCTINNDDNEPQLHLVKTVTNDNGGVAVPSNWTLTATGPTGFSGLGP